MLIMLKIIYIIVYFCKEMLLFTLTLTLVTGVITLKCSRKFDHSHSLKWDLYAGRIAII